MARRSLVRDALGCALLVVTAMGCNSPAGGDAGAGAGETTESRAATSSRPGYTARLNQLCRELQPKVLEVYGGGGHPAPYPIAVFRSEQPRLAALYRDFDARARAIPVTSGEQGAADAFDAYRRESDKAAAMMAAAAATGRQDRFDAAYHAVHKMFDTSPVTNRLSAAGVFCNAR